MRRSERGAGSSAEIAAVGDGGDSTTVRDRIDGPRKCDSREPEAARRLGGGDLRGAKHATRVGVLARRVLRLEKAATDLC